MKEEKNNYGTSQEVLYSVCIAAWNLCSEYLEDFTNLKAFYTAVFVTDAVVAVNAAKALPNSRQTVSERKEARINLQTATRIVMANWQLLKTYITKAWEGDMQKAKLEAAGASLYNKASVDNWSAVRSLIDTANAFITNNLDPLTANQNMPAAFPARFQDDGNDCIELSVTFAEANMEKEMATSAKISANNNIYAATIAMLKDGQQIFKDAPATKRQFTFNYLVSQYRGEGSASLKGYIINALNQPVEGAVVLSADEKYGAVTDSKGYYRISRIAEGTYTFNITCEGYTPTTRTITFAAGIASKGDFTMTIEMQKVA